MSEPFITALRSHQRSMVSKDHTVIYNHTATRWWNTARQWSAMQAEQRVALEGQPQAGWIVYEQLSHGS